MPDLSLQDQTTEFLFYTALDGVIKVQVLLSDALTEKQKGIKISTLLTKLRRQQVIVNTGSDTAPCWQLTKRN